LDFNLNKSGESFDFAQDREPVERLVEPFVICNWVLGFFLICDARVVLKYLNVHLIRDYEPSACAVEFKSEMKGFVDTGGVSGNSPAQIGQRRGL